MFSFEQFPLKKVEEIVIQEEGSPADYTALIYMMIIILCVLLVLMFVWAIFADRKDREMVRLI